jgi:hypothetical protein
LGTKLANPQLISQETTSASSATKSLEH